MTFTDAFSKDLQASHQVHSMAEQLVKTVNLFHGALADKKLDAFNEVSIQNPANSSSFREHVLVPFSKVVLLATLDRSRAGACRLQILGSDVVLRKDNLTSDKDIQGAGPVKSYFENYIQQFSGHKLLSVGASPANHLGFALWHDEVCSCAFKPQTVCLPILAVDFDY